ncbi:type III PLP-dependent enzyme [Tropicibacter sp. Alg240-R139]|uniref:type III PLP-dependent enzyme n=1 Tax=Tropicibacter sp. Alg240-R139 TaxID=2305991 RepID=UPI0013E0B835|nr:type III PLP-dependent enzyme [Tropicibacter sp. Alg240-R139]
MQHLSTPWATPETHLSRIQPDHPVMYLSPAVLQATARRFQQGFDGLVTYAVKANDRAEVLANLVAAGVTTFDVASPAEMQAVRTALPDAVLHYNNPVRSEIEIAAGIAHQVASWSVDDGTELDKLAAVPKSCEISVRFALPVEGAAYDFGEKFGASKNEAITLLQRVAAQGWVPSLCFHPGTQCEDANAWARYIEAAADIAQQAAVPLARLNVGGGFAAHRNGQAPDLDVVFKTIRETVDHVFPEGAPKLICEPGRAMVSEAFVLATRVKGMKQEGRIVFLNDGIYGGLVDLRDMGLMDRVRVVSEDGTERAGPGKARVVFGPTCDSLDRLPDGLFLPDDMQTGDYLLIAGMGAYSVAMSTVFNGYGLHDVATVLSFSGH